MRCGRKIAALSSLILPLFGFLHGTGTSWEDASSILLQKVCISCVCAFPGCKPKFPHFAIFPGSSCCAPSSMARSASSLHMTADILPWAQRPKSLFASRLCVLGCPRPLATFGFAASTSSCQPLSLLHMAFCKANLFQGQPFSRVLAVVWS